MMLLFLSRRCEKKFNKDDIGAIGESKEKCITFNVKMNVPADRGVTNNEGREVRRNIQLRFIGSCRFMSSSLNRLAGNLCNTSVIQCNNCKDDVVLVNIFSNYIALLVCKRWKRKRTKDLDKRVLKRNLTTLISVKTDETFHWMIWKGVYLYEYLDSWKKFEGTKVPLKNTFYSKLNMKSISDNAYGYAQEVCNTITKETLSCYRNIYLKTDVLLLAYVFETFQNMCLKHY